ncbi:hypothetical protein DYB36_008731 [Aphanomyces astaci]|nr:hypothetical protein DYB36_008731 [Aphanomyces astaci]
MASPDRAKILQFATGSTRVPVQGFKGLTGSDGVLCPFSIKAIPYVRGGLPLAHSCFNRIDLPMYPSRELMEHALKQIVAMGPIEFTLK